MIVRIAIGLWQNVQCANCGITKNMQRSILKYLLMKRNRRNGPVNIVNNTVKPVHSGHLRFRKNCPLCTGVRYIEVFIS